MIDMEDVEEIIFQYMVKNGHSPKYILMDKNTYDQFNKRATPKERVVTPESNDYRMVIFHSSHSTLPIAILSVDTPDKLFEAVN